MKKLFTFALFAIAFLVACNSSKPEPVTTNQPVINAVTQPSTSAYVTTKPTASTKPIATAAKQPAISTAAKARDKVRIANLQQIEKILIVANLDGKPLPDISGPISDNLAYLRVDNPESIGAPITWADLKANFYSGKLPSDPSDGKTYYFVNAIDTGYSFGLFALVEVAQNANASCVTGSSPSITMGKPDGTFDPTTWCYAVLAQ